MTMDIEGQLLSLLLPLLQALAALLVGHPRNQTDFVRMCVPAAHTILRFAALFLPPMWMVGGSAVADGAPRWWGTCCSRTIHVT
jgi:hypothetical protein